MDDAVKQFIEKNIDLIEENKWEEVYQKANATLTYHTGKFTEFILEADIHPEGYLHRLPTNFLSYASITKFEIPSNITSIDSSAFAYCNTLKSMAIGNSVTEIGSLAFYDCDNLISVTIPDGGTFIGEGTFYGCDSLTNVKIPINVTYIGSMSFSNCISLTSVTIPDGITEISDYAFLGCTGLTSIVLPNTITKIGYEAFKDCGANLVISYNSTKEKWKKIYNSDAFKGTHFICHCIDGDIVKKKR